ncbi:ATP-binding protein [Aliikangiella sp. IMCC44359]|uniref:ATP-binding protein n=1 Tax=Aliikangiella sp. IMCC44359 TaxID=3459125 RepID=UPI00403AC32B
MKLSLYQKLGITLLVAFIIVVAAFMLIVQSLDSISRDQAEQVLHQDLASHLVNDNPLLSSNVYDYKALENLFHSMMILGPNFEFYVLDRQGKILTYSAKPGEVIRDKIDLSPIKAIINNKKSLPIYADDPRSDQKKVFSTSPILKNDKLEGYLFVIIGGQVYDSIFSSIRDNERIQLIGLVAVATLLFLLFLLLAGFRYFVSPLKDLTQQVRLLSLTEINQKLPPIVDAAKGVEVSELSQAFNQLIEQANNQLEKLSIVDIERRELLAHLSHDLRTPLASLQGFLETIKLKQGALSREENLSYVNRCLKNAYSLKGFVDQIFELAHLESGQVTVSLEKFPIADLLYDMVDKFSLSAQRKNIEIEVEMSENDLMVVTDIAKLERILTNLIENAIRHTPQNGKICLGAFIGEQSNDIKLLIKDSGTGINQDELPYLFDPRYRGSQAIDDESRHIGLGLTITKKLVRLLGSEIKACNNPEGGARFQFDLPLTA